MKQATCPYCNTNIVFKDNEIKRYKNKIICVCECHRVMITCTDEEFENKEKLKTLWGVACDMSLQRSNILKECKEEITKFTLNDIYLYLKKGDEFYELEPQITKMFGYDIDEEIDIDFILNLKCFEINFDTCTAEKSDNLKYFILEKEYEKDKNYEYKIELKVNNEVLKSAMGLLKIKSIVQNNTDTFEALKSATGLSKIESIIQNNTVTFEVVR